MGLYDVPASERITIGIFGSVNAGKSSLINSIARQELAIVSDVRGTTTDPVKKGMEIKGLGPVTLIDTPGFGDEGELGEQRLKQTLKAMGTVNIGLIVVDCSSQINDDITLLKEQLSQRNIEYIVVYNKLDLLSGNQKDKLLAGLADNETAVSTINNQGIEELINKMSKSLPDIEKYILSDLFEEGDMVVLVTPIDAAAPKGRLILPQQLVLREILDFHGMPLVCQHTELKGLLDGLKTSPRLVITDSQVFSEVSETLKDYDIPLTSFSILMARYKGSLEFLKSGLKVLDKLKDGDRVLISECCTHKRQCGDIGTQKMPGWIRKHTNAEPEVIFSTGDDFLPEDSDIKLVVHCGACMIGEKAMQERMRLLKEKGIPVVNYGIAIAHMHGLNLTNSDIVTVSSK